ncbi:hypothetical protein AALO_G00291830 [Alosa alosa]|uniref:DUF4587 domain-containing protein n=1 Tax=Alosa alosa TaxID=278164 RepID=A0AAV6FGZ0_9TELE|nr:hypothetical protein AALO_G00291830 [Alosa alosa]
MNDMVDQMTRLKLKLLEKRLENDRNNYDERGDSAISTRSYDGQADALHSALRRKRSLLQRLRLPQQPATIIQQLPQQQPLITQIPPPQLAPPYKSGSIKEDMVEMMLMQNAQMHQIIMQNMMLKALPPMALNSPMGAGHSAPSTPHSVVEMYPKAKGSAIHHHHHYSPSGPQLPPITYPIWGSQGGAHQPSVQHVMGPISLPPLNTGQRWN